MVFPVAIRIVEPPSVSLREPAPANGSGFACNDAGAAAAAADATDLGGTGPSPPSSPIADSPMSGGTGLDRCRRAATGFGGEYAASEDDGTWTVLLRLPLT